MAYTSRDMRRFNHLLQETDAVYHEMAQHWGLSDSVMGVLYTLCDAGGRCRLRDICYWSGMTKQTVNSALRRMEGDGLIYLESAGRGKDVCLTPEGEALARRGIALRAGLHCAPLAHRTAGTLDTGTLRLSASFFNTPDQADRLVWAGARGLRENVEL